MVDVLEILNKSRDEMIAADVNGWPNAVLLGIEEITRLRARLAEKDKALEPLARAGARVIEERPDAPDGVPFHVMVDEHDNGVITLTWGDLRRAREAWGGKDA